jgi:hypothetical protein
VIIVGEFVPPAQSSDVIVFDEIFIEISLNGGFLEQKKKKIL